MAKSIGIILRKMEKKLNSLGTITRPTALKVLQREEGKDALKILIGTILSSRSRDENTAKVVHDLFQRYKNVKDLADSNIHELKLLIHSIGFYNIKAERIKQVSKILLERYGGAVPNRFEDLISLPGVGRKTANCVLVYAFNKPAIPVDIHVHRISNRIGLVNTKSPEKTEEELSTKVPKKYWLDLNNIFVMYGQNICLPLKPKCGYCDLSNTCKYFLFKKEK